MKYYDKSWFSGTEMTDVNHQDKKRKIDGRRRKKGRKRGDSMTGYLSGRDMKG